MREILYAGIVDILACLFAILISQIAGIDLAAALASIALGVATATLVRGWR